MQVAQRLSSVAPAAALRMRRGTGLLAGKSRLDHNERLNSWFLLALCARLVLLMLRTADRSCCSPSDAADLAWFVCMCSAATDCGSDNMGR